MWLSFSQEKRNPVCNCSFSFKIHFLYSPKFYALPTKEIETISKYLCLRNTSESLGEREMLWEQEPQASVSTAFSSSPKLS